MKDLAEIKRLEALAEAAYARIYDAPPLSSTKDDYDDARMYLTQAIAEAKRLVLEDEAVRLSTRLENIAGVYDSQFRKF